MENSHINFWIENAHSKCKKKHLHLNNDKPSPENVKKPSGAIVMAADFPIEPHELTNAPPGSFYVIRNAGGIVPPAAGDGMDFAIGAALEFAVKVYRVQHIIILLNPKCGLLNCLLEQDAEGVGVIAAGQYLPIWANLVTPALTRVGNSSEEKELMLEFCSQELTRVSFENLMTYRWILDSVFDGSLTLHGWYCDIDKGDFKYFEPSSDKFI